MHLPPPVSGARARVHAGVFAGIATRILRADAFTLGGRIFVSRESWRLLRARPADWEALLSHELVHVEQFRRHGIVRFLARYLAEYARGRLSGKSHGESYAAISFEREAREKEAVSCQLSALSQNEPRQSG